MLLLDHKREDMDQDALNRSDIFSLLDGKDQNGKNGNGGILAAFGDLLNSNQIKPIDSSMGINMPIIERRAAVNHNIHGNYNGNGNPQEKNIELKTLQNINQNRKVKRRNIENFELDMSKMFPPVQQPQPRSFTNVNY